MAGENQFSALIFPISYADIDECSSDFSPCHEQATCSNEVGNFSCECNTGFTGDGVHCEGR